MRRFRGHDAPADAPGYRLGPDAIDIGYGDDRTPICEEPDQGRSDMSRSLHCHVESRKVTMQRMANRRFDRVEHTESGGR
jgi:hypothetical protein